MMPNYDPAAVRPMEEELERVGIKPLKSIEDVNETMNQPGTALVVVNSVCGCAAGNARPGAMLALQHRVIPDHLTTVFAGMDKAAVQRAREFMTEVPPSSPAIALFKDGKAVFILERRHIESLTAEQIAEALRRAFDAHCSKEGPSIPAEEFAKIDTISQCGSTIPLFGQRVTGP